MKRFIAKTEWLGLLALICILAGCKTTDAAGDGSAASVVIYGHTAEEVRQTTTEVFGWNGYTQVADLTFEKQGTKWDKVTYGGWGVDTVWFKMRVRLTSKAENSQVLGCDVFLVEKNSDDFMNSERKLEFAKADECKKILDQIKQRLTQPAAKP
jgi:hypothetical protein